MHHDSTRIKRGPVLGFLLAIAALFLLAIISMGAQAQPLPNGYTRCGAEASGKLRSTGETVRGRISMMAVSPDGYWFWCQPWLKDGDDPTTPEPKPAPVCQGRDTYEEWTVGDLTCTSRPAGITTDETVRLRTTAAGRSVLVRVPPGGQGPTGFAVYRCTPLPDGRAEWRYEGGICSR